MKKTTQSSGQTGTIKATATVVVFSIIDQRLSVLVTLPNRTTPSTTWTLPEETLNNTETAEHTIRRSLFEEFALKDIYLEQILTTDAITHELTDAHEINIIYLALSSAPGDLSSSQKNKMAQWRMPGSLPKLNEKHSQLIKNLWKKLNDKLSRTDIAKNLLPKDFTLSELQALYESILGRDLDTRNFRNKMLDSHLLKSTGNMRGGANRPAALYTFVSNTKTFLDLP